LDKPEETQRRQFLLIVKPCSM